MFSEMVDSALPLSLYDDAGRMKLFNRKVDYSSWRNNVSSRRAEVLDKYYQRDWEKFYIVGSLSVGQMKVIDQTEGFGPELYLTLARVERTLREAPDEVKEFDRKVRPKDVGLYKKQITPMLDMERKLVMMKLGKEGHTNMSERRVLEALTEDFEYYGNRLRFKAITYTLAPETFEEYHSSLNNSFPVEAYHAGMDKIRRRIPVVDRPIVMGKVDRAIQYAPQEVKDAHIVFSRLCVGSEKKHRFDAVQSRELRKGNFATALEEARIMSDLAVERAILHRSQRLSQHNNLLFWQIITNSDFHIYELTSRIPNFDKISALMSGQNLPN